MMMDIDRIFIRRCLMEDQRHKSTGVDQMPAEFVK
jgi:hypothetical protein